MSMPISNDAAMKTGRRTSRLLAYIFVLAAVVAMYVFSRVALTPTRVGDGGEYYAMYLAWTTTHRPFMTPDAWRALAQLADSHAILNFVPAPQLFAQFPQLHLGSTADFNHFWLYSLLAAMTGKVAGNLGLPASPHDAFLMLHSVLLGLVLALAYHSNRWTGLAAVAALTVLSPMVWYIDKVHTEFFTYCVVYGAVIALTRRWYFLSAVLLALASTQNISFAAIAVVPLIFVLLDGGFHRRLTVIEVLSVAFCGLLTLLHPAYYFFRYGAIDPQLIAGGASIGGNLRNFFVWLLDLDIGLLPNWPLGVILIGLLISSFLRKRVAADHKRDVLSNTSIGDYAYPVFCIIYLVVNLFAQSSTEKLNSGATPGLARYATWYIPLFYPVLSDLLQKTFRPRLSTLSGVARATCLGLGLAACASYTYALQRPTLSEAGYVHPSPVSRWVQTHWPNAYDPPAEIFAKRYSGIGEAPELANALAITGPDCRKILLSGGAGQVFGATGCGFDEARLSALLRTMTRSDSKRGHYIRLSEAQAQDLLIPCPAVLDFTDHGNARSPMLLGFSLAEPWGRWSDGPRASIVCASTGSPNATITALGFVPREGQQSLIVSVNNGPALTFNFGGTIRDVKVPLKMEKGKQIKLAFRFPNATSPYSLGLSADKRELAIGVVRVRFGP